MVTDLNLDSFWKVFIHSRSYVWQLNKIWILLTCAFIHHNVQCLVKLAGKNIYRLELLKLQLCSNQSIIFLNLALWDTNEVVMSVNQGLLTKVFFYSRIWFVLFIVAVGGCVVLWCQSISCSLALYLMHFQFYKFKVQLRSKESSLNQLFKSHARGLQQSQYLYLW